MVTHKRFFSKKSIPTVVALLVIVVNIILSAWYVLHNDILFHTDIARDFLVLENIATTHKLTLIGGSSGIPGFFHGPLWFFLNLPTYLLAGGNPIGMGWFWVVLSIINILSTYYFAKQLFNKDTALLTALLTSVASISYVNGLMNPYGAVMLFLPFFYFYMRYIETVKIRYLLVGLILLGCIIQFQIAFGGPLLILICLHFTYNIIKKKKYSHCFAFLVLFIPFSSYILFDIRHNFLQTRSVIAFFSSPQVGSQPYLSIVISRLQGLFIDGLNIPTQYTALKLPVTLLFLYMVFRLYTGEIKNKQTYHFFFYLYIGFWTLLLFYKGVVWGYIFWPFSAGVLLVFSSASSFLDKKILYIFFGYVYILMLIAGINTIRNSGVGWKAYRSVAQTIYRNAKGKEFGYFVYSPDQLGYSEKCAMLYVQKEFPETKAYLNRKKNTTYLTIAPPPYDRLFLNGKWWKSNQVKISKEPIERVKQVSGIRIEKYSLNEEECRVQPDPNLVGDLIVR